MRNYSRPVFLYTHKGDVVIESTLRLFNAVQVDKKLEKLSFQQMERTVKHGYILDSSITTSDDVLNQIENIIGISGEKANSSFHKSWSVIRDASIEQLVIQQLLHYFTTYGFEELGIYNNSTVYIPAEKLEIPEIKEDIPLTIVRGLFAAEIYERIVEIGSSGIALAEKTLHDIITIVEYNKYDSEIARKVTNRELKIRLCDYYCLAPEEPEAYLRYVISKITDESLLIKNKYLISKIMAGNGKYLDDLLIDAPKDLASIFYRYKPLFLAMKSISRKKHFFNRLRKNAIKMHKPVHQDILNTTTDKLKKGSLLLNKLDIALEKASIFRKIRLAYALNYRQSDPVSIVYRVRNGKGWATDFKWSEDIKIAYSLVLNSITDSLVKNVAEKVFYIPEGLFYSIPATEKQFSGKFPCGTCISVDTDLILGIYWKDTNRRIDLDLSLIDQYGQKYGWDSSYRSDERTILFSGDVTGAHNGASELFYLKNGLPRHGLLMVNYFNYSNDDPVPCKVFVAKHKTKSFSKNYMVDPNHIIVQTNIDINKKQQLLAMIKTDDACSRVFFTNVAVGNSITSRSNDTTEHLLNYLISFYTNPIYLENLLQLAGATVLHEKPEDNTVFIDLSPENITKDTFIKLIS